MVPGTDELWAQLDPDLWASTHNPWALLQSVSPRRVEELFARAEYRQRVADLLDRRREYLASPAWFQQAHAQSSLTRVAYFSMEFALSEALPIYSGGLGTYLGRVDPEGVRAELYAEPANGAPPERHVMARGRTLDGSGHAYVYDVRIPALRPAGDYTPRLVPYHPAAVVPLEAREILWQR